jgi:protein SCO1/2
MMSLPIAAPASLRGAIGGPFELVDENGVTVTDTDVITTTLIYFGYTFCPRRLPARQHAKCTSVEVFWMRKALK